MTTRDTGHPDGVSSTIQTAPGGRSAREGDTGWRARLRRTPGGALLLKAVVFVVGALFIALGIAAAVLPGPLTIPPMLLGLYVLASEFDWADRLLQRAKKSAQEAWVKAKRRPVLSAVTTVGGLVAGRRRDLGGRPLRPGRPGQDGRRALDRAAVVSAAPRAYSSVG